LFTTLAAGIPTDFLAPVAPFLYLIFAGLTVASAWMIVISQNIVRMAMYLLFTLGGVAGLYFLMNAEFLAAIQLIVYAGGTLILIVFGVMLTSKNPFMKLQTQLWERCLAVGLGLVLSMLLMMAVINTPIKQVSSEQLAKAHDIHTIGSALLGPFLVPFEVAAVLLLVVMIGAAYMARRRA
jgi:NADH-quinone oxidoreductase subunit J